MNVPAVSQIHDAQNNGQLTLIIASLDEKVTWHGRGHDMIRVFERHFLAENKQSEYIVVDSFLQLKLLTELNQYPGLYRLLNCRGWCTEDFRKRVLSCYANALDAMQETRCVAIFGAQRLGELVHDSLKSSGIHVKAFVDNNSNKHYSQVQGVTILPLSSLPDKELPIVIATTRFSNSIARQLEDEGFKYIIPYSVLSQLDTVLYPDEIPYIGIQQDLADHQGKYLELFLTLEDDKSRRVLDGLLSYRLSYDTQLAESVSDEYSRQYFDEELIEFSADDIFVDLGAFDGDTVEKYIQFSGGSYTKIYLFEPDDNLIKRAVTRLSGCQSIAFIQAGAYSSDGELKFAASGRTNGSLSEVGELTIPIRKLDSVVTERPTLIKIDIEGAEEHALRGAANLLQTARPKLAIAAYHFASDLWQLVHVVREINPSYKFYLRHYSETGLESVIYACCEQASNF